MVQKKIKKWVTLVLAGLMLINSVPGESLQVQAVESTERVISNNVLSEYNPGFEAADFSGKLYWWNDANWSSTNLSRVAYGSSAKPATDCGSYYVHVKDGGAVGTCQIMNGNLTKIFESGVIYEYSYWARLGAGETSGTADLTIKSMTSSYGNQLTATLVPDKDVSLSADAWTKVTGTFVMPDVQYQISVAFTGTTGVDFYVDDLRIGKLASTEEERAGIELDVEDLWRAVTDDMGSDFLMGGAVTATEIQDEGVVALVQKHFNALTIGNELKPDALFNYSNNTCPGTRTVTFNGESLTVPIMNFTRAESILDEILAWNAANPGNRIKVRGHVLVWHSQTPEWFFREGYNVNNDYVTPEVMNKRLEWFIMTVLEHFVGEDSKYKDLFYGWDVVNEAVSDATGTYRTNTETTKEQPADSTHGTNSSWWAVYESNEFIINAFKYANKYAPASLELYYNDYSTCNPGKRDGIVALLNAVKDADGTRIDGMGMQGHYNMSWPSLDDFEAAVRAFAAVVGDVQITEWDFKASDDYDGTEEAKAEEYIKQAYRYKEFYDCLKKLNAEDGIDITGITVWGVIDKYSWLQSTSNVGGGSTVESPHCPLLFDDNYKVKPAYWAFVNPDRIEQQSKSADIVKTLDGSFGSGNVYNFDGNGVTASFVPVFDGDGLKLKVTVLDITSDAADSVTVYVDENNTKTNGTYTAVTVNRANATAIAGGYEAEITVALASANIGKTIAYDVVVVNGTEKTSYSDISNTQDTTSKYYAEGTLKPYIVIAGGTPIVDGVKDSIWNETDSIPLQFGTGADASAQVKLLWDANALYVYAEITDAVLNADSANAYEQDSLEVFIDENNGKTITYEKDDKQYRISYLNGHSFNGTKCLESNITSVAATTADGYVIEAAFKWTDITPGKGLEIGLDFQVNDADSSGSRIGTLNWYDASGMAWTNAQAFGTAILGEAGEPVTTPTATPKPAATPTAAPTATPKPAATPTATSKPTVTPTAAPTATPTAAPTATPGTTTTPTPVPEAEKQVKAFVTRMYTEVLDRTPDTAGIDNWTNWLLTHEIDGAGIAHGFIMSKEFLDKGLSDEAYVDVLYKTFFNRVADAGGKETWMNLLANGSSRGYVLSGFVNSKEFDALCESFGILRGTMKEDGTSADPGIRRFVERCYSTVLGREGDKEGLNTWTAQILTGQMSAETVAKKFFESEEFLAKNTSNATYIDILYETFLNRTADVVGRNEWIDYLAGGMTRTEVLEGFSRSEEFKAILKDYGLE